jgi:hypothetical protein
VNQADLPSGLRRALARADAGKTLSADEATWLLSARGAALERLDAFQNEGNLISVFKVMPLFWKIWIVRQTSCPWSMEAAMQAVPPVGLLLASRRGYCSTKPALCSILKMTSANGRPLPMRQKQ